MIETAEINAIAVANDVNVSTFDQLWLVKHEVLGQDESGGYVTPVAVNQSTEAFDLLILPDRIQVKGKGDAPEEAVCRVMRILLSDAPDRSFALRAIGFNILSILSDPNDSEFVARGRCLLASLDFLGSFTSEARCGILLSAPLDDGVMTLELKPARDASKLKEAYVASYNFHLDTADRNVAVDFLDKIDSYKRVSSSITDAIHGRLTGRRP